MTTRNKIIKHLSTILLFIIFMFGLLSFTQKGSLYKDSILGTYWSPNKRSKIEFIKKNELYYGVLIWNVNIEIKDKNNSNENLISENLIGKIIFNNLKYNPYTRSWTGKFYDADSGNNYDCDLWLGNSGKYLFAKGYLSIPTISRTEYLRRVD